MAAPADGDGERTPVAADGFEVTQRHLLGTAGVEFDSRFLDLRDPPGRLHVVDVGEPSAEPPVLLVHGITGFGALFAPLLAELDATRVIAIDRPGWGLSDDHTYAPGTHRRTAINVLSAVLDELGVERVDLVGHSTGGFWGTVFALARPERLRRLVAIGGVPSFPGTRPPIPARLFTSTAVCRLVFGRLAASRTGLVEQMRSVGERETIERYPALVEAWVAANRLPRTARVTSSEYGAFVTLRGWRRSNRLTRSELEDLTTPTTFVWGERDFLGGPDEVRPAVESIPDATLEVIPAGHIPWFGHPGRCAEIVGEARRTAR